VATVVTQARESFEDSLLEVSGLEAEWESTKTDLGKFYKLSQMLADKAKTLAESYVGAMDGDMNKEAARKERFRGMLQESVVEYAEILLALNELTDKIKTDWKMRVDTKQKVEPIQVAWVNREAGDGTLGRPEPSSLAGPDNLNAGGGPEAADAKAKPVSDQKTLRKAFAAAKAAYDQKTGVLTLGYDFMRADQKKDWEWPDTQVANSQLLRGIHIGPEVTVTHRALFVEGACSLQFVIADKEYRGSVMSAGPDILVWQHPWGRVFRLCDREAKVPREATAFQLVLTVGNDRSHLKANATEIAVKKSPSGSFRFALHGGENGNEFGAVVISGKPDPTWFQEVLTSR